ncbi:MAG: universal stress protein [Candidatus Dadabacteria bacterium]|nr:MAG: universal stress protein [Candidatus Dadabacteria bacterium]
MGAHVDHKLSGPVEGALAGGGDPATSPLYVFGPFLKLLVAGGVASICFGAAVWLAVFTVVTVSAMYWLVMHWIPDGSGGSGLNEEEFGGWAVKINASITVIEYTLTFLVSVAALVTFIADRYPALNQHLMGMPLRTYVAVLLTLAVGFAVNLGPKISARLFGPATAAVLLLLWAMILATIWRFGFHLPSIHWEAFAPKNLHYTLGGYARILALMTGIEIFANLVAAYQGTAAERANKAFGSLLIIMGTTSLTMLIVGPAIHDLSNPLNPEVSVFTQTMDKLLPHPLPYVGTLIGIAVLLSAAAASAQGIQNLSLGLRYRHYIPAWLGERNRFQVADRPVWLQVLVCVVCFIIFGTLEETYLALYAAGVFILLSLTGWAAVKRLLRHYREEGKTYLLFTILGTGLAALLTTGATLIIFEERFMEGAWCYFILVPVLYFIFGYVRKRLGAPGKIEDRLGSLIVSSTLPPDLNEKLYAGVKFENILVPLDQSPYAELTLAPAQTMARHYDGTVYLLTVLSDKEVPADEPGTSLLTSKQDSAREYLDDVVADMSVGGYKVETMIRIGNPAEEIGKVAKSGLIDLVIMTTHGRSRISRMLISSVTTEVIFQTTPPLLVIRPTDDWRSNRTRFKRLLVCLDGSDVAEQVLPYVHELSIKFDSEVILLTVPEGSDSDHFPETASKYLEGISAALQNKGVKSRYMVTGSGPVQTILEVCKGESADLIMMVSHGRGGTARQEHVKLGSIVDSVLQQTPCPVFLVSAR